MDGKKRIYTGGDGKRGCRAQHYTNHLCSGESVSGRTVDRVDGGGSIDAVAVIAGQEQKADYSSPNDRGITKWYHNMADFRMTAR